MLQILTSWDDGGNKDIRLAELLKEYDIPAIFFIPNNCELKKEEIKYIASNFELGGHTVSHPMDMKLLDEDLLVSEVKENKEWLETFTTYPLRWFCYPRGRYNQAVASVVRGLGYLYGRTTKVGSAGQLDGSDMEVITSIHCYDRQEYEGQGWLQYLKNFVMLHGSEDGILHIWGHSWEIDKFNDWNDLKEAFEFIKFLPKYEIKKNI